MQASHLRFMERRTFDNISGVFRISPAAALMRATSSSALFTGVSYTKEKCPQKKSSRQERSGYRGGQCTGPPRPIHRSPHVASKRFRTEILKCAGAPSCWNHMEVRVAAVTCALSNNSGKTCSQNIR
ncbi:uncharacterized protein TNCV_4730011 [Trichonephila clavipes]|nr:uncharacterized protein TNCV_4730011 [Trichonephila clavipes]